MQAEVNTMAKAKKSKNHYGQGSIFYIESKKKWMGQLDLGKDESGKRIRKTVLGDTPEGLRRKCKRLSLIFTPASSLMRLPLPLNNL